MDLLYALKRQCNSVLVGMRNNSVGPLLRIDPRHTAHQVSVVQLVIHKTFEGRRKEGYALFKDTHITFY